MVTIKQIAEKAGVSIGTVDRVLHDRGNVSADAKARVLDAVGALNYTPNLYARQLKLSRTHTFGVIMPELDQDSGYWEMPGRGIEQARRELEAHRVAVRYFHYDRYSHMSFSKCCEAALQADLDGFLMAPALSTIAKEFVERLPQGVPCVFFDSPVPEGNGLCSIVQDSYASGFLAGRLMTLLTGDASTVAAIRGLSGDYHIQQRITGFSDYFQQNCLPSPQIVDSTRHDDKEGLRHLIADLLQAHPRLKGLFVSDAVTFCAAQVLDEQGMADKVFLIGYDLLPQNVHYLKQGQIDFLISQQSKQQGYHGIYALFRNVVLKERVAATVMMPIDIITRENVDFYPID